MKKNKIYYCRHGQTDRNLKKMMNPGDIDSNLNDTGIQQAHDAGKNALLQGLNFDIIISSPLKRVIKTAEIIAEETNYSGKIIMDNRLIEQLAGELKDYSHEDIIATIGTNSSYDIRKFFRDKKNNKVESAEEFIKRIHELYSEIQNTYHGKSILLVAHSGTYRPLTMIHDGTSKEQAMYKEPSPKNAKILTFK